MTRLFRVLLTLLFSLSGLAMGTNGDFCLCCLAAKAVVQAEAARGSLCEDAETPLSEKIAIYCSFRSHVEDMQVARERAIALGSAPGSIRPPSPPVHITSAMTIGGPPSPALAEANAAFLLPLGAGGFTCHVLADTFRVGRLMLGGATLERSLLINGVSMEMRAGELGGMLARSDAVSGALSLPSGVSLTLRDGTPLGVLTEQQGKAVFTIGAKAPLAAKGAGKFEIVPYSGQPTPTSWPGNRGFLGTASDSELAAGTLIDRYGARGGSFVSPAGTPFGMRGLPATHASLPLETYEVVSPFRVKTGPAAPAFGQPGLGMQHELPFSVQELIDLGLLKPK